MTREQLEVGIVGTGAVASALVRALGRADAGVRVRLYGRNALRVKALVDENAVDDLAGLDGCPIVVVAVSDSAVDAVVEDLASALSAPTLIVHTSGALPARARGESVHSFGCMHPLVAITNRADPSVFEGRFIAIEGDSEERTRDLVETLGGEPLSVPSQHAEGTEGTMTKARYHALATMVATGVVSLVDRAAREMGESGGDEGAFRRAYASLAASAAMNVSKDAGRDILTGAVARGDEDLIALHRRALAGGGAVDLYESVVAEARRMSKGEAS